MHFSQLFFSNIAILRHVVRCVKLYYQVFKLLLAQFIKACEYKLLPDKDGQLTVTTVNVI